MLEDVIVTQLKYHEGLRLTPYRCTSGRWTLGYGRNIQDNGITEVEALYLLNNDIAAATKDLEKIFFKFWKLPEIVQRVLIDMRFNLGVTGFRSFKKMIKACKEEDFYQAALEMQDSDWFGQVGQRGETLLNMMLKAS